MPKPTALRVLSPSGERDRISHRKVNTREPKPRLGVEPVAPQLQARARKEYDRIVDELKRAAPTLLTRLDDGVLMLYCESKFQWLDLVAKINADLASGQARDRFDVVMMSRFAQQMHMAGDRLGLSPAARTRLAMPEDLNPPGPDDDDF